MSSVVQKRGFIKMNEFLLTSGTLCVDEIGNAELILNSRVVDDEYITMISLSLQLAPKSPQVVGVYDYNTGICQTWWKRCAVYVPKGKKRKKT